MGATLLKRTIGKASLLAIFLVLAAVAGVYGSSALDGPHATSTWVLGQTNILAPPMVHAEASAGSTTGPGSGITGTLMFAGASTVDCTNLIKIDDQVDNLGADTDPVDDIPDQADMSDMGFDFDHNCVSWTWDDTLPGGAGSGGNTGDACALFDTDGDGGNNFALCAQVDANDSPPPDAVFGAEGIRFFTCDDRMDKPLNCWNALEVATFDTVGALSVVDDPFAGVSGPPAQAGEVHDAADCIGPDCATKDLQFTAHIDLMDFGSATPALTNVCSYPSGPPNSDSKDCIVPPDTGFLVITKDAGGDTTTEFSYNVTPATGLITDSNPLGPITGGTSTNLIAVDEGTYAVSELPTTNWEVDTASCAPPANNGTFDGVDSVTGIVVGAGQTVACTFTNKLSTAHLTLLKSVTNDNGGGAVADAWTLTADGAGANDLSGKSGVSGDVLPGEFNLSESGGPGGYTQTDLTCDGGTLVDTTLTLTPGETVTCTFVNDDVAPQLTVIKTVVKDNGGTAVAGDWTMDVTAINPSNNNFAGVEAPGVTITLDEGNYSVDESGGPSGYTKTLSADCTGSIAAGESKTCTITNDDVARGNARITPTGTTCEQYVNGTAVDFSDFYASQGGVVQYGIKADKINSTNPGVFFYYTGLSGAFTGSGDVLINQEDNNADVGPFSMTKNDVKLWLVTGTTCQRVQLQASRITISNGDVGDVKVNIAAAAPLGSYYVVSVRYDTGAVKGADVSLKPTVLYTITTEVGRVTVESDPNGITLAPKF